MDSLYKKIDSYLYDPTKPIGEGSYAKVYQAFDTTKANTQVAVKVIPFTSVAYDDFIKKTILREVEILRQLKGEHVVRLHGAFQTKNNLYLFMDYCDGGDLAKKLEKDKTIPEDEACMIIKQIAKGFIDLGSLEIGGGDNVLMHRDIKPANILFNEGRVKLGDFGFAKAITEANKGTKLKHTLLGSPNYMSPQILSDDSYSAKCDIWSTGEVFYQIIFGHRPWDAENSDKQKKRSESELLEQILSKPLSFPGKIREETKDLIKKMLKIDEAERIWWNEVLMHPALNFTNEQKLKKEQNK